MRKIGLVLVISGFVFLLGSTLEEVKVTVDGELTVREALMELDAYNVSKHEVDPSVKGASIERGRDIVTKGFTRSASGRKTSRISKHFVCTSCHNIQREDPDLSVIDPQARLEYTNELGIPFVQGSPFYGIVNRDSFYNDDYYKKYGDLVFAARDDLRQSIQLCSTECSQGRKMRKWELESVLMYMWTLELKVSDLNLTAEEEASVVKAMDSKSNMMSTASMIKSKYMVESPAHFIDPPVRQTEREKSMGDAENGALIYKNSCMHCHDNRRYSFFKLDNSKGTFRNLRNNLDEYHERSIYQVARYGTSPVAGKRAYMPQYTKEKMSVQQLEDLKAYIIQEAK
jgi:mono/diheme cytochrome c family protein